MTLKIMDGYAYMRLEIKDVLMDIYTCQKNKLKTRTPYRELTVM